MSSIPRLAVYGSLQPGRENHYLLAKYPGSWSRGRVRGDLVNAGWGAAGGYLGFIPRWNIFQMPFPQIFSFILFMIAGFAETNRVPFDLPEAENELVAGFHTEYSSMKFACFFMSEYANMVTISCVATLLFLGGWHPLFPAPYSNWIPTLVFLLAAFTFVFQAIQPARRVDRLTMPLFALGALVLAIIGLYGLLSFTVTQRQREIGVRMALGAQRFAVLNLVVGQGMRLVLIGAFIGLLGSFALTRVLASVLFKVAPTDPLTFVTVTLSLCVVALLACYIPARRATKIDPMVALRYE